MTKRNRNRSANNTNQTAAPSAATNEIDDLLAGIEATIPDAIHAEGALEVINLQDDELLADLGETETITLKSGDEIDETLVDAEVIQLDPSTVENDISSYYESQKSSLSVASDEDAAPVEYVRLEGADEPQPEVEAVAEVEATADPVEKPAKATKEPRVKRERINTAGMSRADTLLAKANVLELTKIGISEADIPGLVSRINDLPTKVQGKAYNMLRFCMGRETLSGYTSFIFELLSKNGTMTVPEVVKAMEARGTWKNGTIRSQAQQISSLFRAYEMINTEIKAGMTLNAEQPFVKTMTARLKAA